MRAKQSVIPQEVWIASSLRSSQWRGSNQRSPDGAPRNPGPTRWSRISLQPDGQITSCFARLPVQPHLQKYFHSRLTQIKSISFAVSSPAGAYRDRHGRGVGCGGRGSVGRALAIAGRVEPCERFAARWRTKLLRTAKPCGPGTRCWCQVGGGKSARPGADIAL